MVRASASFSLVLFFTTGVSLKTWDAVGMFDREVALYRCLAARGVRVAFITYGGAAELAYAPRLPGIRLLCNRWEWPAEQYRRWLPWLHAPWLLGARLFKTNQISGAEVALRAARLWGRRLIVRGGYLLSEAMEALEGAGSPAARSAGALEQQVFKSADHIVLTTPTAAARAAARYPEAAPRITVIPNYVETDRFSPAARPDPQPGARLRIGFVGRLEPQKNPLALLQAVCGLDVELVMVGSGSLQSQLEEFAQEHGLAVEFLGNRPNREIPAVLRACDLFVLPSLWEGHPKTLLEAMACGLPVVGTDVPGVRELIRHGETGWLCAPTADGLQAALRLLLADHSLRTRLGQAGRDAVLQHFALDRVLEQELALYHQVLAARRGVDA